MSITRFHTVFVPLFLASIAAASAQDNPSAVAPDVAALANSYAALDPITDYFTNLPEIKKRALDNQPHWVSPIITTTARLEQNIRYEQTNQQMGNGATLSNVDNGKGVRVITSDSTEIQFNPPPIERRTQIKPASGTGDWQFTSIRYRIASANEDIGNYVLTVYSNFQAPSGVAAFTNHAWIFTPSVAFGKGWGDFDIQSNISVQVPGSKRATLGTALIANIAFQYHLLEYFWPQVEFNDTRYYGGLRGGMNQLFITPGILFGRFPLALDKNLTFGLGYQVALLPTKITLAPALTPTYDHALILAARVSF